jgi:hypothetical protein
VSHERGNRGRDWMTNRSRADDGPPKFTAEFVRRLVERLFPVEERTAAAALLERYGPAAHEREPLRVRVAALKLSGGQLAKLESLMNHARRDYRDILAWAEYPEEMTQPTWGLALPEVERIRAADRAQYLAWLAEHGDS